MMTHERAVLERLDDAILPSTLNRPDRFNAMNQALGEALIVGFDRADQDDVVRAVIVTGSGRAFCAGADISAGGAAFVVAGDGRGAIDYGDPSIRDFGRIELPKPINCAIKESISADMQE